MTATARRTRLTTEREAELYQAVIDLVREVGYDAMTMDAVASRSRSSKATLYRQWQGKLQLVVAAMRHTRPVVLEEIDTGSLRGDLHELAARVGTAAERDTVLMSAIGHAVQQHPELGEALREVLVEPERVVLSALLQRAVDRGEVRADAAAAEFFAHMLLGAVVSRKFLEDRFADADYLTRYVDAVVLPALRGS
jgi:AcrR family transcriptional regulator